LHFRAAWASFLQHGITNGVKEQPAILVVEDSNDDIYLLKLTCKKAGIKTPFIFATNGEEGIKLLEQFLAESPGGKKLPRIVLTDLKMPKVSGFELLEYMLNKPACKKVIPLVWSSSIEASDFRLAHALGARFYFQKPRDQAGWKLLLERVMVFYNDSALKKGRG
jgi:CheY-like chemotaxis protein